MNLAALVASASVLLSQGDFAEPKANYQKPLVYAQAPKTPSNINKIQPLEEIKFYVGVDRSYSAIPDEQRALFFEYNGAVFRSIKENVRKGEHPLKFVRRIYREHLPGKRFSREFYHTATELFSIINNPVFRYDYAIENSGRINEILLRKKRLPDIKMTLHPEDLYEVPLATDFKSIEEAVASTKPKK